MQKKQPISVLSTGKPHPLTPGLIYLLAVAAGLTVANIYYNQPLLETIAQELRVSRDQVSWLAIATQLGYASGLLFLVPLGDIANKKTLIAGSAMAAAVALLAVAFSVTLVFAVLASYLVGMLSITPQLIVPYAAGLADSHKRGRVVGTVMSGLLIGILFSRSISGFLASWIGWRNVFISGAAVSFLIGLVLLTLPSSPVREKGPSYWKLLASLFPLWKREPVLRRHALVGALAFSAFSAFWTTLAFYLAARPEHYGSRVVGLFALMGMAGAAVAPISGHYSDRYSARWVNGVSLGLMIIGFGSMGLADYSIGWLVVGVFLMDAGAQGNQISNQARIYTLSPQLRNRLTAIYMVIYFLGGALGSAIGAKVWTLWHWPGVWMTGIGLVAAGLIPLFTRSAEERREISSSLDESESNRL